MWGGGGGGGEVIAPLAFRENDNNEYITVIRMPLIKMILSMVMMMKTMVMMIMTSPDQ